MLLLGVQGCGKSLCAKVVASAWRMPLVRMDPGVLYQKFVGETRTPFVSRARVLRTTVGAGAGDWASDVPASQASPQADRTTSVASAIFPTSDFRPPASVF